MAYPDQAVPEARHPDADDGNILDGFFFPAVEKGLRNAGEDCVKQCLGFDFGAPVCVGEQGIGFLGGAFDDSLAAFIKERRTGRRSADIEGEEESFFWSRFHGSRVVE